MTRQFNTASVCMESEQGNQCISDNLHGLSIVTYFHQSVGENDGGTSKAFTRANDPQKKNSLHIN